MENKHIEFSGGVSPDLRRSSPHTHSEHWTPSSVSVPKRPSQAMVLCTCTCTASTRASVRVHVSFSSSALMMHELCMASLASELMRWGGRPPEWLIIREREQFICKKLTFANWWPLMNEQLSSGQTNKLFNSSYVLCNCQNLSKAFHEASLHCMINHICMH